MNYNYYGQPSYGEENSYTPPELPQQPQLSPPPKKEKRSLTQSGVIAITAFGVLFSGVMGFSGGYLAANLSPNQSTEGSSTGIAPQSTAPTADSMTATGGSVGTVMSVSQVANSVADSVVAITVEQTGYNLMREQVTATGAGSGVIISSDGYIVTNNHVIEGASTINIRTAGGQTYTATLIGTDEKTDLAVLKVDATGLTPAVMGDSSSLTVGDDAIAIGNPLGELGGTVTNGIISALDREITLDDETMNLLQTNAAINPGNSGGGLFNNKGELVGVVVAKSSGAGIEGLGFAIPVDDVKAVTNDLINTGYVTGRSELGISVIDIQDPQTAFLYRVSQPGVYVATVTDGSAAQKASLQVGDGITAIGDTKIESSTDLRNALKSYTAGSSVTITILRDGQSMNITAVLDESIPEGVAEKAATAEAA